LKYSDIFIIHTLYALQHLKFSFHLKFVLKHIPECHMKKKTGRGACLCSDHDSALSFNCAILIEEDVT